MPQAQQPATAIFVIVLLFWLLFPEGEYQNQSLLLADLATDRLHRFHDALNDLNQTAWGDFDPFPSDSTATAKHLNLTGFRSEDGLAWEDLSRFREKGLQLSRFANPPIDGRQLWDVGQGEPTWTNISGTFHGDWVRRDGSASRTPESYNLTHSVPSMDWSGDHHPWARNMTGMAGRMLLRLEGNKTIDEYTQLSANEGPLAGGAVRSIKGTSFFEDTDGSGLNWEMRMWGVHWPRQGVLMMTTTSEKFEGLFGLPHLTPSADFYQSSQQLLNRTIAGTLAVKEQNLYTDQDSPWNSDVESSVYTTSPSPHCEYILYSQIHPPSHQDLGVNETDTSIPVLGAALLAIESELESPRGAPVNKMPTMEMSTVLWSPDCAFFLESKGPPEYPPQVGDHLRGMKSEVHLHQIKSWLLVYALVMFGQVYLQKNQMQESYTPSTMGRVSFWTSSIMVTADGMAFTASATWVLSAASTFLPTMTLMFASFLSMIIGGSFLAKIHEVQIPETSTRRGQTQQSANATPPATSRQESASATPSFGRPPSPTSDGLLPRPVTAPRSRLINPEPVIVPSDQDISAEIAAGASAVPGLTTAPRPSNAPATFQSIIGRYILFSLFLSFLAISSSTWYFYLRSWFLNVCIFFYLSLWVPQIYRNTIRNCRRALSWQFVVGQSALRLLPVAYFWVNKDNFLFARPDHRAFLVFCAWLWIQLVVLAAQDVVGPRFGVPASWTPEAWDYHPVLREDNLEGGGLPIGLVADDQPGLERQSSAEDKFAGEKHQHQHQKRTDIRAIDCAICREVLEVPVLRSGEEDSSVAGAFARRMYMVTPCRHIFHTACLEGWMKFRLQCPICREELPPL